MTSTPLMFEKVYDNIHNAYNRLAKQPISATNLPRQNYSEVCKVLGGIGLLDLITDVNVELTTNEQWVTVIFSKSDGGD